jgi:hypothetical protein
MSMRYGERSIPDIVGDLLTQFPMLIRTESRLARAEMSENISKITTGIVLLAIGAVLLVPALVILLDAAVAALVRYGFQPAPAALIVGVVVLVVGLILAAIGIACMKAGNLVPDKTVRQVREDASVVKQQMRSSDDVQRAA